MQNIARLSLGLLALATVPLSAQSTYVPMDSWVYPAFERLIATGFISGAYLGIRPWTHAECLRLIEEAEERLRMDESASALADSEQSGILTALASEFGADSEADARSQKFRAGLDSIYFRSTGISGPALGDGYHFGQTVVNDYGRPYSEGFNSIAGFASHAQLGPLTFFVHGETQHSPALGSAPQQVLAATAAIDGTQPVSTARAEINRFRLLESTVGIAIRGAQLTFGRQSLWLGPGKTARFCSAAIQNP